MNKKLLLLCCDELLPLGSRMHIRLAMDYANRTELIACMKHLLDATSVLGRTQRYDVDEIADLPGPVRRYSAAGPV